MEPKQRSRTLTMVVMLALAFGAGLWVSRPAPPEPSPTGDAQAVAPPERATSSERRAPIATPPAYALPPAQETPGEHAAETRAATARNETRWASAARDTPEALRLEQKLSEVSKSADIAALRFKPDTIAVQCRSTMCRIESEFPPGGSSIEWLTRMQLSMGGEIGNVIAVPEPLPGGRERLVMYAYRLGQPPPM